MSAPESPLILLAEDDPLSMKLMRDVLQMAGYRTTEVTTGREAVLRTGQLRPAAVVMDIGLPELDGIEATRRIKADPATCYIPVIAVTAYAMPEDEERVRRAGCDAYMTKPLRFAHFIGVIGRLAPLALKPGQASSAGSEK